MHQQELHSTLRWGIGKVHATYSLDKFTPFTYLRFRDTKSIPGATYSLIVALLGPSISFCGSYLLWCLQIPNDNDTAEYTTFVKSSKLYNEFLHKTMISLSEFCLITPNSGQRIVYFYVMWLLTWKYRRLLPDSYCFNTNKTPLKCSNTETFKHWNIQALKRTEISHLQH